MKLGISARMAVQAGVIMAMLGTGAVARASEPASDQPIRLIVAYAAGGQADLLARALAAPLSRRLGQNVIVDNRAGAGGAIGTRECANAAADGRTLCLGSLSSLLTAPMQMPTPPYRASAFTPIAEIASFPAILAINPRTGVKSLDELKAWARQQGSVSFGTSGNGTLYHLLGAHWANQQGLAMEHVAYKGGSAAIADAIGGHIPLVFDPLTALQAHLDSGALIGLAYAGVRAGNAERYGLPPLFAPGSGVEISAFQGILGPAGLPAPVVERLSAAIRAIGEDPEVRRRVADLGGELVFGTAAAFNDTLQQAVPAVERMIRLVEKK